MLSLDFLTALSSRRAAGSTPVGVPAQWMHHEEKSKLLWSEASVLMKQKATVRPSCTLGGCVRAHAKESRRTCGTAVADMRPLTAGLSFSTPDTPSKTRSPHENEHNNILKLWKQVRAWQTRESRRWNERLNACRVSCFFSLFSSWGG